MATLQHDIKDSARRKDLFQSVFKDKPYAQVSPSQTELTRSPMGIPLFFPLTFVDGNKRFQLPNAPMIQVQGKKTIVKTPVAGRDGTMKEIIAAQDYQVSIWGFALKESTQVEISESFSELFPSDYLSQLHLWYSKNAALGVECELLRILGIHHLVIEKIAFPMIEGALGLLPYEITALSDEEVETQMKKN